MVYYFNSLKVLDHLVSRLLNKKVLVTGSAQGIGLAVAQLFIDNGARVFLSDINDELGQKETNLLGDNAQYLHLDVSQEQDWIDVADKIKKSCTRILHPLYKMNKKPCVSARIYRNRCTRF